MQGLGGGWEGGSEGEGENGRLVDATQAMDQTLKRALASTIVPGFSGKRVVTGIMLHGAGGEKGEGGEHPPCTTHPLEPFYIPRSPPLPSLSHP